MTCFFCNRATRGALETTPPSCAACVKYIARLCLEATAAQRADLWGIDQTPLNEDAASVLTMFKEGTVDVDARTRLDLAVAYGEMGLTTDMVCEAAMAALHLDDVRSVTLAASLIFQPLDDDHSRRLAASLFAQ